MNEIQLYSKFSQPDQIISMGLTLGKSGCFGFDKAEQGVTALMVCMCDNISLATFMRTYHVLPGGKFSKKAMACFAEFRKMGGKIKWLKTGDEIYDKAKEDERCATAHVEFEENKLAYSYSIADAKREKVWKTGGRYETRPGQVLRARVITNVLGMLAPEIFAGEDEGDYIAPEATLNLESAAPKVEKPPIEVVVSPVAPAPKVESKMSPTMAKILGEDEKELAAAGLAPQQTPVAASAAASGNADFVAAEKDGKLMPETINEICRCLGSANVAPALDWMTKAKWLNDAGELDTLSLSRAKQIIKMPAAFLKHCGITK